MSGVATVEDHRAVSRKLVDHELWCCDLAWKYARRIKSANERTETRLNYELIAAEVYSPRPKPLRAHFLARARKFDACVNCVTREEALLDRDLAAVSNDPQFSIEWRKYTQQQREELHEQIESRRRDRLVDFVRATTPSEYFKSRAERWLAQRRALGKDRFFQRLETLIRRYSVAREKGQSWVSDLELLHLLYIEWLHNATSLWCFIEAALNRWNKISDPRSSHRRSVVAHQILGTDPEILTKQIPTGQALGWKQVVAHLERIGAIAPGDASAAERLRKMSSRQIRDANSNRIRVTNLNL